MKILSRILVTLFVLLGVAFLIMLSRASAADKMKYEGSGQFTFGVDANGCETGALLQLTESQIHALLKAAGVGKECYKIRYWNSDGQVVKEEGSLDLIQCITKEGAKSPIPEMLQPSGAGSTQRIMFYTPAARDAFEKQSKATKK